MFSKIDLTHTVTRIINQLKVVFIGMSLFGKLKFMAESIHKKNKTVLSNKIL